MQNLLFCQNKKKCRVVGTMLTFHLTGEQHAGDICDLTAAYICRISLVKQRVHAHMHKKKDLFKPLFVDSEGKVSLNQLGSTV